MTKPSRRDVHSALAHRELTARAVVLLSSWDEVMASPARWCAVAESAHHDLHMERVHRVLSATPISQLQSYSGARLRLKPLQQAGVSRIVEVATLSASDFMAFHGIGPKSAPPLAEAVATAIGTTAINNPPRIGRDETSLRLLVALFTFSDARRAVAGLLQNESWQSHMMTAVEQTHPLSGWFKWWLAGSDDRQSALDWLPWMLAAVDSAEAQQVRRAHDLVQGSVAASDAYGRFATDASELVSILNEALPGETLDLVDIGERSAATGSLARRRPNRAKQPREGNPASTRRGARKLGPYRIKRELGSGFFGNTYLAANADGVEVALKVLKPEHASDPRLRQSIGREIKAGQRVNSRYFARVLRHDLEADEPWVAQQLVPGTSLAQILESTGGLPDQRIMRILEQLVLALEDLDRYRLVHLDLKPENIQIGDNDAVTILDLGVSWAPGDGASGGDVRYTSPESLLEGAPPAPANDMWAAGVILAELVTGTNPVVELARREAAWSTDPSAALALAILDGQVHELVPKSPWRTLVEYMTDPDPAERPSPSELRSWLENPDDDPRAGVRQQWIEGLTLLLRISQEREMRMTMELGNGIYMQWAHSGDHLQVEISANQFVESSQEIHREQEKAMVALGFEPPHGRRAPNWWMQVGPNSGDYGYARAAEILIRAAFEVYQIPAEDFAREAGDELIAFVESPAQWIMDSPVA